MLNPAETVKLFQSRSEPGQYGAGSVIFEPGQIGKAMYGILAGEVELSLHGKVVETLKQGDVFGEGALVQTNGSRYTTAIAKTDCTLACMSREHFLFAIQETPLFALEIVRSLSTRLRRLKDLV